MKTEIKAPQLPESVPDGTIATWYKNVGEKVSRDDLLVDIETDKVVIEVVAPDDGVLAEILKVSGDIFCINLDILMILFGKIAHKIPSISRTKPIAIINSFMPWLLFFAFYNSGISKKFKKVTIW